MQKYALSVQKPIRTGPAPCISGGGRFASGTLAVTSKKENAPQAPPMGDTDFRTALGSKRARHAYICVVALAPRELWMYASRFASHAAAHDCSVIGPICSCRGKSKRLSRQPPASESQGVRGDLDCCIMSAPAAPAFGFVGLVPQNRKFRVFILV